MVYLLRKSIYAEFKGIFQLNDSLTENIIAINQIGQIKSHRLSGKNFKGDFGHAHEHRGICDYALFQRQ